MLKIHFIFSYLLLYAHCLKQFRLGRSKDGNLGAPDGLNGENLPPAQWFLQKLDHSSKSDLRTWKQRYFINESYYDSKNPGPVFLMIGGEGPADARWLIKGAWIEYAKYLNALCINLEHRYYGESRPTVDLSVKNLQYLSSEQALDDLANFIQSMNDKLQLKDPKWIAFGGSYSGSLAAWLRLKYPHLVYAAVSSSGPMLAKVDFRKYYRVVVNSLSSKSGSNECMTQVMHAHQQIDILMKSKPEVIEAEFRVCKPFSEATTYDMKNFYNSIAEDFAGVVQYNEDNRIGANENSKNITINTICEIMTSEPDKPAYKKLGRFNSMILDQSNQTCLDYSYDNMIKELQNVTWSSDGARQWMYQTCTEFGFYQTSSDTSAVFGNEFTVDFFVKQCEDVFGSKYNMDFIEDAVRWTNINYGAKKLTSSRVVFIHGSIDPWHALGITDSNEDMPAIYINGTAHCADMYPSATKDNHALTQARMFISKLLFRWISA